MKSWKRQEKHFKRAFGHLMMKVFANNSPVKDQEIVNQIQKSE